MENNTFLDLNNREINHVMPHYIMFNAILLLYYIKMFSDERQLCENCFANDFRFNGWHDVCIGFNERCETKLKEKLTKSYWNNDLQKRARKSLKAIVITISIILGTLGFLIHRNYKKQIFDIWISGKPRIFCFSETGAFFIQQNWMKFSTNFCNANFVYMKNKK